MYADTRTEAEAYAKWYAKNENKTMYIRYQPYDERYEITGIYLSLPNTIAVSPCGAVRKVTINH